jgi:hypothetical protein
MGSETYAGSSDTCATITGQDNTAKFCFNSDGVVAYESIGSGITLTLTGYTTAVPDADFALPAVATALPPAP